MFIFTLSDKAGFTQLLDKQQALNKVTNGCVLLLHSEMVTIKIPEEKNKVHQSRGHRCIFTAGPRVCKERLMWWEKCWLHEHDMTQKTRSRVVCMPEIYYSRGQPPKTTLYLRGSCLKVWLWSLPALRARLHSHDTSAGVPTTHCLFYQPPGKVPLQVSQ